MTVGSTLLGAVGALLLVACWTDISSLRIPNWVSAGIVGLFPLFAIGLPLTEILQHVLVSFVVLVGGLGLFAWGKLGGGDVKLLTAISLWVGWGSACSAGRYRSSSSLYGAASWRASSMARDTTLPFSIRMLGPPTPLQLRVAFS